MEVWRLVVVAGLEQITGNQILGCMPADQAWEFPGGGFAFPE